MTVSLDNDLCKIIRQYYYRIQLQYIKIAKKADKV